jgi:aspartyl-tRNA(Asn)/glutamyl-tRNA(Gln) amidotransferase subunit A
MITNKPTIKEIHELYREGKTVSEVTNYFLNKIDLENERVAAYIRVQSETAIRIASFLDALLEQKNIDELIADMPLFGIPFALKDNVLVEGLEVRAASKILEDFISPYTADIVKYMYAAGAVLLGQTNMDEFAFGSSSENTSYSTIPMNPLDTDRVAGGSSGGSASAVAAGLAVFSIGSDTGGSVRLPASFTGIFGIRPSWGLVSRYGVVAASSSFDQPGIFANSGDDIFKVLHVISSRTSNDATQINTRDTTKFTKNKKIRVGIPSEYTDPLPESVKNIFWKQLENYSDDIECVPVSLPSTKFAVADYYVLMTVEAASNLERYDGIRYGIDDGDVAYHGARSNRLGKEARRRIMLGTYASSAGYYDAYYKQAARVRRIIQKEFEEVLSTVDVIATPTSPFPAFKIGEKTEDPIQMYLVDIMTTAPALAQNASISIPFINVEVEDKKLPIGLQLITQPFTEQKLHQIVNIFSNDTK